MTRLEKTDAIDTAIESIVKLTEQVNRRLITPTEGSSQLVRILVDMKIQLREEFLGDIEDKLSNIEQLFTDVQDSINDMDYLTVITQK